MEMNNLNKLDYAMEETLAKFTRNNEGEQYKKMFIEQFCRSGYSQTLFTRDNNARQIASSLSTELILSEMLKYASRAKAVSLEKRYDQKFYEKYPFILSLNSSILEYTSTNEANFKNIVSFFVNERYKEYGDYLKNDTDRPDIFKMCEEDSRQIDNYFQTNQRHR